MKRIIALIFIIVLAVNVRAQDFIFFSDSPASNYYDPSWGTVTEPSFLELINTNKFPVSTSYYYSGINSLKLHWNSKEGGDWRVAVAAQGWPRHNIYLQDSISFYVYSEDGLQAGLLPQIFIEDSSNKISPKFDLSDYSSDIPASSWTKIFVPLSIFKDNPGQVDLTKIKTIFFGQSAGDSAEHTLFIDEVRMVKMGSMDTDIPSTPTGVLAKGYERHIDISWNKNPENNITRYYIYRLSDTSYVRIGQSTADIRFFIDWTNEPDVMRSYKVTAVDVSNNESEMSDEATASTFEMNDDELLTMLQEATFRYFWDYAHPVSGLARERLNSGNTVTSGGSGFGVMAILVGIERGFITREEGVGRLLQILNFLNTKADRFHGAFSHWLNGETGAVIPFSPDDNGGDLVETSFMIQGLLTARQYFNLANDNETQIRNLITSIWESVEWNWYRKPTIDPWLYWHWSPNFLFQKNHRLWGYNEVMITYLLAIASPTYSIPHSLYYSGWAHENHGFNTPYVNGKSFYGMPLFVGQDLGGPLFFAHYSYLGFDPRNKKEKFANYFIHNRNHTLINRAHSIANPNGFQGYDENTWGLTASDGPSRYSAHSPTNDNGTIAPTAALSSFPYTPEESMAALKNFYRNYGEKLWSVFGFKDAFNLSQNWFANSYIAIDQGPIIIMIENHRSELLWKNFMANEEIQPMLDSIGFVPDITDVSSETETPLQFELKDNYPNPFNPSTIIEYSIPNNSYVELKIYNILGKEVSVLINEEKPAGRYKMNFNAAGLSSGVYFYSLKAVSVSGGKNGNTLQTKKLILMK